MKNFKFKVLSFKLKIRQAFFLLALISCLGCSSKPESKLPDPSFKVGLVFDVGGRGDKSFNDSAYRGLERAQKELGVVYQYIEPAGEADKESGLRQLASQGYDLVFGIGFLFTDDITRVALDFPNQKFACVDYALIPGKTIPPNLLALRFREQEGSYLIGALAGLVTKTNAVGFVGGMDIPLIHKFESGFRAGFKKVNPQGRVLVGYAGMTGDAFKDPTKGKELGLSQYSSGADIIYHASGSTGLGVFEAARQKNKLAIGVDSDQYHEAPGYILTSMTKKVDETVFKTIEKAMKGEFEGGVWELGLKENGVGYVYDLNNKNLLASDVVRRVEVLRKEIESGKILVPKTREELAKLSG